jgi:hypothetical protein
LGHPGVISLRSGLELRLLTWNVGKCWINFTFRCGAATEGEYPGEDVDNQLNAAEQPHTPRLLFVEIFARNIVLRDLVRANFLLVGVPSALHASHDVGLERVPFLD